MKSLKELRRDDNNQKPFFLTRPATPGILLLELLFYMILAPDLK
jgi:hypothetical protein